MGLHRAHPQKTNRQACTKVKPTGEEEPSPSKEQMEKNCGERDGQGRLHLEADREVSPKQIEIADGIHEPMLVGRE